MYNILICDDDRDIVEALKIYLSGEDYRLFAAYNGQEALDVVRQREIHCILMDVMMPRCSGLLATMRIRQHCNVPILMLSAKAEGSDRVLGLEAGADDYLVKPFYQEELLARVKALLRRYDALGSIRETHTESRLQVGDIALDLDTKQLLVRGDAVRVTPTEYKILRMLLANPGHVFSSEEIYSRVWDREAYAVENTVMVHISRIREKLEVNPKKPEYLKVVWGIGYVLEAP